MRKLEPIRLKPWALPLIIVAIAVPIVAAFMVGGPGAGLAAGALAVLAILVIAARAQFDEPIEVVGIPGIHQRRAMTSFTSITWTVSPENA